jgi:hypothetical protein
MAQGGGHHHLIRGIVHLPGNHQDKANAWSPNLNEEDIDGAIKHWQYKEVFLNHKHDEGAFGFVASLERGKAGEVIANLLINSKIPQGRRALDAIKNGQIKGLSLGQTNWTVNKGAKIQYIKPLEISLVDRPGRDDSHIHWFTDSNKIIPSQIQQEQQQSKSLPGVKMANNFQQQQQPLAPAPIQPQQMYQNYQPQYQQPQQILQGAPLLVQAPVPVPQQQQVPATMATGQQPQGSPEKLQDAFLKFMQFMQQNNIPEDQMSQYFASLPGDFQRYALDKQTEKQAELRSREEKKSRIVESFEPLMKTEGFPLTKEIIDNAPPQMVDCFAALGSNYRKVLQDQQVAFDNSKKLEQELLDERKEKNKLRYELTEQLKYGFGSNQERFAPPPPQQQQQQQQQQWQQNPQYQQQQQQPVVSYDQNNQGGYQTANVGGSYVSPQQINSAVSVVQLERQSESCFGPDAILSKTTSFMMQPGAGIKEVPKPMSTNGGRLLYDSILKSNDLVAYESVPFSG